MKLKKIVFICLVMASLAAAVALNGCGSSNNSSGGGGTSFFPTINI